MNTDKPTGRPRGLRNQPLPPQRCQECGETYEPRQRGTRFCSRRCSWRVRARARHAEERAARAVDGPPPAPFTPRVGIILPAGSGGYLPGSCRSTCTGGGPPTKVFERLEGPSILAQALAMMG